MALSRFGNLTNLHETSSSFDFAPIPTFSFVGAKYSSRYIAFTPYEEADRSGRPLEVPPPHISALYKKYDGTGQLRRSSPALPQQGSLSLTSRTSMSLRVLPRSS